MKKINKIMFLLFLINGRIYNMIDEGSKQNNYIILAIQNNKLYKKEANETNITLEELKEAEEIEGIEKIKKIEDAIEAFKLGIKQRELQKEKEELEAMSKKDKAMHYLTKGKENFKQGINWTKKKATAIKEHIKDNRLRYAAGAMGLAMIGTGLYSTKEASGFKNKAKAFGYGATAGLGIGIKNKISSAAQGTYGKGKDAISWIKSKKEK